MATTDISFTTITATTSVKPRPNLQQCNIAGRNGSHHRQLSWLFDRGWEGVPETFIINAVMFLIFVTFLATVRYRAFAQRLQALTRPRKTWIHYIYGFRNLRPVRQDMNAVEHDSVYHSFKNKLLFPVTADLKGSKSRSTSRSVSRQSYESINMAPQRQGRINRGGTEQTAIQMDGGEDDRDSNLSERSGIEEELFEPCPYRDTFRSDKFRPEGGMTGPPADFLHPDSFDRRKEPGKGAKHEMEKRRNIFHTVSQSLIWFVDSFRLDDKEIKKKRGQDAHQYLLFQRYIIYLLTFISCCSLGIALPINILSHSQENMVDDPGPFGRTTIAALNQYYVLWIHVCLNLVSFIMTFCAMTTYSRQARISKEKVAERTLLIQRIPQEARNKRKLSALFSDLLSRSGVVTAIQFAYTSDIFNNFKQRHDTAYNSELYAEEYAAEYELRMESRQYCCGSYAALCCCHLCSCFSCWAGCQKTDAIQYFQSTREEAEKLIMSEYQDMIDNPSGTAFVTFVDRAAALEAKRKIEQSRIFYPLSIPGCQWLLELAAKWFCSSRVKSRYEMYHWDVQFAPYPDDINWLDISQDFSFGWIRTILVHIALFLIFIFLSTPTVALSVVDILSVVPSLNEILPQDLNPLVEKYLPILILLLMTSSLPAIISKGMYFMPYIRKSQRNMAIMWKVYIFLVMMILVLPGLGLSSASAAYIYFTDPDVSFPWHCLFPVDSGAFFVNYVIQSALIGNGIEMLRLSELVMYAIYMANASSPAEYQSARKSVQSEFVYGVHYPRLLLIFVIVVSYSFSVPLIAPCGLLYVAIKHAVDRYNIYFVYAPSKISARIHNLAILFLYISMLISQFQLFTFIYLHVGFTYLTMFSLTVLLLSTLAVISVYILSWFARLAFIKTLIGSSHKTNLEMADLCACAYVPESIMHAKRLGLIS